MRVAALALRFDISSVSMHTYGWEEVALIYFFCDNLLMRITFHLWPIEDVLVPSAMILGSLFRVRAEYCHNQRWFVVSPRVRMGVYK